MVQHHRVAADVSAEFSAKQGKTIPCITVFARHANRRNQYRINGFVLHLRYV